LIKAPIPGVITKINVQVGEQIKKGDNLLVLEAMKMQNNIFSPIDAKVLEILVITGEEVSQDKILIKLS
ncbi:MAG: acetyl-CoA carboxylase biotin carboxyl carrier protein subunit, partial [Proteobacteria bacterium]|nr:acetyl-CoA carboxylase biotin carboxyl carrier protein subunit [Pseudomonadota bacterium]